MQDLALLALRALAERGARTGYLQTGAGAIRFAVHEAAHRPQLLLLHGLGDSLAGWARVVPQLAREHEVHLIDLPGHGLSRSPPDWRVRTLLDAVTHYAEGMRAEPIVVGHSLGGWLALGLAQRLALARLKLVNPGGAALPEEEWMKFRALVGAEDSAGVHRYLDAAFHRAPLALRLFPGAMLAAMQAESTRGFLAQTTAADLLQPEALAALRLPIDLIWATRDRLLPAGSLDFFRGALPHARVVLLEKAGHLPHLEAPRALARALLD